ncbi:hypothetical protein SynBIOSE41_03846 [Synechococcus sp. BIOS-E4-1]|nr:hypothetical protein SynBIOSE41_03846 [Synechococcus sp. BIOS-E4-1]
MREIEELFVGWELVMVIIDSFGGWHNLLLLFEICCDQPHRSV